MPAPPPDAARLRAAAQRQLEQGDLAAAGASCRELLALAPEDPDGWFLAGMVALGQRRGADALAGLRRAVSLKPACAEYQAQLARSLLMANDLPGALAAARAVLDSADRNALALDTAGVVFSRGGDHRQAAQAFGRAVGLAPGNAAFQFNLGSALRFLGDFAGAERAWLACLAADPQYWRAWPALVALRPQGAEEGRRARLEALLAGAGEDPAATLMLNMALARVCEDAADFASAFRHLAAGKGARRRQLDYRSADDAALFAAIERLCPEPLPPPAGPDLGQAQGQAQAQAQGPVFILGMPRTGTTLAERILTGHPLLAAGGELPWLPLLVQRAGQGGAQRRLDVATLERAAATDPAALGRAYLQLAGAQLHGAARFTDKQPVNFLFAGLIARALPQARMVCLRRDPLDTCVANFRQLLAQEFSYYDYSWDLLDIGRYWLLFDRLVAHWRWVLPGRFLELSYEALLEDPEREARRLLEFCGLPWHTGCLDFAGRAEPVATASAVQVRRGLNREGLGRWRRYEPWLGELKALLARP